MNANRDFAILITGIIVYIVNQVYLKSLGILFFNNHLNDLIAVPIYFSAINIVINYFTGKRVNSFKILFVATVILAFMGEYLSLFVRKGSIFDYWDILCYFVGLVAYYILTNFAKETAD